MSQTAASRPTGDERWKSTWIRPLRISADDPVFPVRCHCGEVDLMRTALTPCIGLDGTIHWWLQPCVEPHDDIGPVARRRGVMSPKA